MCCAISRSTWFCGSRITIMKINVLRCVRYTEGVMAEQLLKYVAGAKPGKRAPTQVDGRVATQKRYEEKGRDRKFLASWAVGSPWLRYASETNSMFCDWCIASSENSSFSSPVGCDNLRLDAVKSHEISKCHLKVAPRFLAKEADQSEAKKCILKLKETEARQLSIKFRNAHYIAKHNKPFTDFKNLCLLDKMKGLDVGTSYVYDKGAAEVVHSIASVTRKIVLEHLNEAKFFSFTVDGSCDFTGEDFESLYVRTCINGTINDEFLNIGCSQSACAKDIHSHIENVFRSLELEEVYNRKLVGYCADGAANMQGLKSGLAALLKTSHPHIVVMHCLAHRLELSFKDAVKKLPAYDKLITLLLGLYYFYKRSPKMKQGLKQSFGAMNKHTVLPTCVGGTRWLSHIQLSIGNFIKGYVPIRHHLESASHVNAKAEGFAKIAGDGNVIVFMLSLQAIIAPLSMLSRNLQKVGLTIADANRHINATKRQLAAIITPEEISKVLDGVYQGESVSFRGAKASSSVDSLSVGVIKNIEERIPNPPSEVMNATQISDLNNWPVDQSDIQVYGVAEIKTLLNHFQVCLVNADVDIDSVLGEWQYLKHLVLEKYTQQLEKGKVDWPMIYRMKMEGLINIFHLLDLVRSLPPTSVRNECSFSIMKITKTKLRAQIKESTLNNLMTVNLQGPSISEFDPKEAVEHFMGSSKRRAGGYQKKTSRIATSDVLTEEGQPQVETSDIEECQSEDTKESGSDEEADLEVDEDEINQRVLMYSQDC